MAAASIRSRVPPHFLPNSGTWASADPRQRLVLSSSSNRSPPSSVSRTNCAGPSRSEPIAAASSRRATRAMRPTRRARPRARPRRRHGPRRPGTADRSRGSRKPRAPGRGSGTASRQSHRRPAAGDLVRDRGEPAASRIAHEPQARQAEQRAGQVQHACAVGRRSPRSPNSSRASSTAVP